MPDADRMGRHAFTERLRNCYTISRFGNTPGTHDIGSHPADEADPEFRHVPDAAALIIFFRIAQDMYSPGSSAARVWYLPLAWRLRR